VSNYFFILKTLNLLREHKPGKLLLIFTLAMIQGINSGFTLVLLIPMLQLLNIGSGGTTEGVAHFFRQLAGRTGLSLTIESVLLIYVILLTINALIQYWKSIVDSLYQQTFIYELRRRLFRKIILANWPLLNSKSKTNHLQVLTKEVPNLANYYYFYLRLITSIIMTSAFIVYAMVISPVFTLIIIATGALLFLLLHKFLSKAFHLGESAVNSYNRLLKYIDDFWQTVKIAKVHSSEEFYYKKFDEANSSLLDLEYRMQLNYNLPQLVYRISGIIVLVVVVYAGYKTSQVPITSFFILILLFSRIYPQFVSMNTDLNMIISNVASVRLVMQLDEEFPESEFHMYNRQEPIPLKKEISLENLGFAYPDGEKLFTDFSVNIKVNNITGITGESGRGKTTLIDIIAGLQKPDSGQIFVDEKLLDDDLLPGWKAGIGYLPQDPFFIDGTLRENLVWDSKIVINDEAIIEVLDQVNASHLVSRFKKGLDEWIVNYPYSFSGGECQRLALARVLLRKPRLLFLDEATSSLDADNEKIIMDVITRLREKVTIIFVTHRASLLPYFDKVIKL
jgi:ATP-binding cassette, subfamily C, bacterial